jgi:DNA-binding response OmpR family regulator
MSEKERILVVDDEETIVMLLEEVFTDRGYEVESASDGAEAIAKLRTEHYDLVVTDFQMQDRGGADVAKEVKDLDLRVPVLVLTASAIGDEARLLRLLGVYRTLPKPIALDELCGAVEDGLRNREQERREVGRLPLEIPCRIVGGGGEGTPARIVSLSVKGASVQVETQEADVQSGTIEVVLEFPSGQVRVEAVPKHLFVDEDGVTTMGLQFRPHDSQALKTIKKEIVDA